jgi:general stress protein 26
VRRQGGIYAVTVRQSDESTKVVYVNDAGTIVQARDQRLPLVEDEKLMQKLWRPKLKSWFPEGVQEPDLIVLRVDIDHAEAWDANTRVWNRVKNKTTGNNRA